MKVSLNQIQQYIDFELPEIDELVDRVNQQLGGVEEVIDLADKYRSPLIVKVVECSKHPDADRLSITKIDDGGQADHVDRDANGLVQVVCGAPNVQAGQYAIWLPPTSTVPSTYSDDDPFVLAPKELRGVISNGMLAAADELDLGQDHTGIITLSADDFIDPVDDLDSLIGASFASLFGLDDTVIDIENKMFTHRPDLFGQIGVAREISAILKPLPVDDQMTGQAELQPAWYFPGQTLGDASGLELTVFNDATDSVKRFMAVAVDNIEVKQSPLWLKAALVAMGAKPVNSIVDATNYVMLQTGQPTHAYDYDKLAGHTVGSRFARPGETVELLNGKTYQLDESDIVIADAQGPIGLGGVMGGLDSQVTEQTKSIVLEVASFDMYQSRRTSMRHGLFTDAVTRFSKGQSPIQNSRVLSKLIDMVGGQQASPVADHGSGDWDGADSVHPPIEVSAQFISARLGQDFSPYLISNMLRLVNFASWIVEGTTDTLHITAPFWRTDIELPEDIVEEIGRLYGFDKLPRSLPVRSIKPAATEPLVALKRQLRQRLVRAGANEVLNYSFVNAKLLEDVGQQPAAAFSINNALSPDLQHYRLSLTPSLLDRVHGNIKAGQAEFVLFEIGKTHNKADIGNDGLPAEGNFLAGVVAANQAKPELGAAFYSAKRYLEHLLPGQQLSFSKLSDAELDTAPAYLAPYQPDRSAIVWAGDSMIGVIGEFQPRVARALKLPDFVAGFEIDLDSLLAAGGVVVGDYQPLSRYPSSERDISFRVSLDTSYGQLLAAVEASLAGSSYDSLVSPLGIYQAEASLTKNITIRIKLTSHEQTLTSEQVNQVADHVVASVKQSIDAEVV